MGMSSASEVLASWPDSQARPAQKRDDRECIQPSCPSNPRKSGDAQLADSKRQGPPHQETGSGLRGSKQGTGDRAGATSKCLSASVWLATGFPVPLQQFLPILDALALEHEAIQRLKDLLASSSFQQALHSVRQSAPEKDNTSGHTFPVRASVPLNLAVRAVVHFEAFQLKRA